MTTIPFYTEQPITPAVKEVLAFAVREVYGDEKVSFKKVGKPGKSVLSFGKRGDGVYTLSPKQIMAVPNALSVLCQSLRVQRDGYPLPEFQYQVVDDPLGVTEWLSQALPHSFDKEVALDAEWDKDGRILCLGMYYGETNMATIFSEEVMQDPEAQQAVLEFVLAHYYQIWANGKADQVAIRTDTEVKLPVWFDTMLAHHSLHPSATGQHGLKEMAERYFGVPDWDKAIDKYARKGGTVDYGRVPRDLLYKYNGYDVFYTYWLAKHFMPMVEGSVALAYELTWADTFADIEFNGIKVDLDHAADMRDKLLEEQKVPAARLAEWGIENPNSHAQVKRALLIHSKLRLESTDAKVLENHLDNPIVSTLLEYRGLNKKITTYYGAYEKYADAQGFLHPTFNIHGTGSGRTSASRPNVQNQVRDRDIRNCFPARAEDRVIIECDYAQGENRVQAVLSGDPDLIAAFQPDAGDYFDQMMPVAFPETFPSVADYKALKAQDGPAAKNYRAKVKGVDYGQAFGRGAAAIAKALGMPTEEAQAIIDSKRRAFPEHAKWREQIMEAAVDPEKRDMLTTPHGLTFDAEVIVSGRRRAGIQRSALSFLPQGCLAFIGLNALVRVNARLKVEYPEALVVNFVHDAIHVDAPRAIAKEVGALVEFEMEQAGRDAFGDVVIFAAEPDWAYRLGELMD